MPVPKNYREYVKPNKCPFCLAKMDCATAIGSSARPRPDDFSVCIRCGEVSRFDAELNLVKCPPEALNAMDQRTHREIVAAQSAIRHLYRVN